MKTLELLNEKNPIIIDTNTYDQFSLIDDLYDDLVFDNDLDLIDDMSFEKSPYFNDVPLWGRYIKAIDAYAENSGQSHAEYM